MDSGREIAWEGFFNARDLGGPPDPRGWMHVAVSFHPIWRSALRHHSWLGARLKNSEYGRFLTYATTTRFGQAPVRGRNREGLNGTPVYFRPFLDRSGAQCAPVITAVARAVPGAVLFHCGAGRDRTGLITLLLLALVDIEPEAIADD